MKIYILIPLFDPKPAKIEDRAKRIATCALAEDYAQCFGVDNRYYIDLASQAYDISGWKHVNYKRGHSWYYSALNPRDVIKLEN